MSDDCGLVSTSNQLDTFLFVDKWMALSHRQACMLGTIVCRLAPLSECSR
jgi:hypothetical protein